MPVTHKYFNALNIVSSICCPCSKSEEICRGRRECKRKYFI